MNVRTALAALFALSVATNVQAQSIEGVWKQVEIETVGGPNPGSRSVEAYNTIWIIADGYHSLNAASATMAERARSADPTSGYTAFAGTYERDGNRLTLHVMNALNPSQDATMTREIAVTPTTFETRATSDGVVTIRRYRRLE